MAERTLAPYGIRLHATIPAEVTRVFYALVLDEYVEMWAGTSDAPVRCTVEPRCGGRLHLECFGTDGRPIVLTGTITRFETGSMATCMLSEEQSPDTPHCLVLTVHPHDGGTRIELLQMGLGDPSRARHIECLWQLAFERLSTFFTNVAVTNRSF
jgi:uncharacterized protein YndB with AHSA1/START domain